MSESTQQFKLRRETHVLASRMGGYKYRDKWQAILNNAKNRKGLTRRILGIARPKVLVMEIVYPEVDYNEPVSDGEIDFNTPGITLIEKAVDDGTVINEFRLSIDEARKLAKMLQNIT